VKCWCDVPGKKAMSEITKVSDVKDLVRRSIDDPSSSFPEIKVLAVSDDWKVREVAASVVLETGKKKPEDIIAEMLIWADDADPNVRRTASEGLREIARRKPEVVLPVLAKLKADRNLYVKKSVANVLRNAGNYHAEKVLEVCRDWAIDGDTNTAWIIKDGLRKLKLTYPNEVEAIISSTK
jgi:3-methyladenine DNA glycosylase AlkC